MSGSHKPSQDHAVSIPAMIKTAGRLSAGSVIGLVAQAFGLLIAVYNPTFVGLCFALVWLGFGASLTVRTMLGSQVGASIVSDGWRSIAVYSLIAAFFALVGFVIALALIIFSVVLVVASGHDPSTIAATETDASLEALRQSGAIWILYALLIAGAGVLVWLALRLTLCLPATLTQQRLHIFRTWGQTKGHILNVSAVAAFALLPALVLMLVAYQLDLGPSWNSFGLLASLYLLQAMSVSMFRTLTKRA